MEEHNFLKVQKYLKIDWSTMHYFLSIFGIQLNVRNKKQRVPRTWENAYLKTKKPKSFLDTSAHPRHKKIWHASLTLLCLAIFITGKLSIPLIWTPDWEAPMFNLKSSRINFWTNYNFCEKLIPHFAWHKYYLPNLSSLTMFIILHKSITLVYIPILTQAINF